MAEDNTTDETECIEIEVSSEDVAREVGYGIIGRAMEIHNNPDDEFEDSAKELRDLGRDLVERYEDA